MNFAVLVDGINGTGSATGSAQGAVFVNPRVLPPIRRYCNIGYHRTKTPGDAFGGDDSAVQTKSSQTRNIGGVTLRPIAVIFRVFVNFEAFIGCRNNRLSPIGMDLFGQHLRRSHDVTLAFISSVEP